MTQQRNAAAKLKVFMSYSRRDIAFVEKLVNALETRGIEILIDRRDLPLAVEFQKELLEFIRQADTVVYVVSRSSIASPWCAWEVEQVQANGKRLAPVVIEQTDDLPVPEGIRRINYVFFTGEASDGRVFEERADALARALKIDLTWIKEHTRIGELARRWNEHRRDNSLLLRGRELEASETWRLRQPAEAPPLSALQQEFIGASRRAATQRQRRLIGGSLTATIVALALAGYAYLQRNNAVSNELRALAELSENETARGNTTRAIGLSLQAFDTGSASPVETAPAERAMYEALWRHRELRRRKLDIAVQSAWFDQSTGHIVVRPKDEGADLLVFNTDLQPTGKRGPWNTAALPLSENGFSSEEFILGRPYRSPPPARTSLSTDGKTLTLEAVTDGTGRATSRALDASLLPFKPKQAWSRYKRGEESGAWFIVEAADETNRLAVVPPDQDPVILGDKQTDYMIDPSAQFIVFGRGYGAYYFVDLDNLNAQVSMNIYHEATKMIIDRLAFSAVRDIAAFLLAPFPSQMPQPVLVDAASGVQLATLGGHESIVAAIDFAPDGQTVMTVTEDGVLRLWSTRVAGSAELATRYRGSLLPEVSEGAENSPNRFVVRFEGPPGIADQALAVMGSGAGPIQILTKPADELIVATSGTKLAVWKISAPEKPLFVTSFDHKITDVAHWAGSADDLFVADAGGYLHRLRTSGETIYTVDVGNKWSLQRVEHLPGSREALLAASRRAIYRVEAGTGKAHLLAALPVADRASSIEFLGDKVVYKSTLAETPRMDAGLTEVEPPRGEEDSEPSDDPTYGVLISLEKQGEILRTACEGDMRLARGTDVAYCSQRERGEVPLIFDLKTGGPGLDLLPDRATIAATGLKVRATIKIRSLEGCRRAFIDIGGGAADYQYPGEGLLYDFSQKREIAHYRGDPRSSQGSSYGGGEGLPVFCRATDAADYARASLAAIKTTQGPDP